MAVYGHHVISSKGGRHLSLFTQLSDPVTFTDKNCPGKHSNANPPAMIMTHLSITQDSFHSMVALWRWLLSFNYSRNILLWIDPVQFPLWGCYYLNLVTVSLAKGTDIIHQYFALSMMELYLKMNKLWIVSFQWVKNQFTENCSLKVTPIAAPLLCSFPPLLLPLVVNAWNEIPWWELGTFALNYIQATSQLQKMATIKCQKIERQLLQNHFPVK